MSLQASPETVEIARAALEHLSRLMLTRPIVEAIRETAGPLSLEQRVVYVAWLRDMTFAATHSDANQALDDPVTSADLWGWLDEAGLLGPLRAAGYFNGYSYEQLEAAGIPITLHPLVTEKGS